MALSSDPTPDVPSMSTLFNRTGDAVETLRAVRALADRLCGETATLHGMSDPPAPATSLADSIDAASRSLWVADEDARKAIARIEALLS